MPRIRKFKQRWFHRLICAQQPGFAQCFNSGWQNFTRWRDRAHDGSQPENVDGSQPETVDGSQSEKRDIVNIERLRRMRVKQEEMYKELHSGLPQFFKWRQPPDYFSLVPYSRHSLKIPIVDRQVHAHPLAQYPEALHMADTMSFHGFLRGWDRCGRLLGKGAWGKPLS